MPPELPPELPPQHPDDCAHLIQLVHPLPCGTCNAPTTYGLIWPGERAMTWTLILTCPAGYRAYQADLGRLAAEEARERALAVAGSVVTVCRSA